MIPRSYFFLVERSYLPSAWLWASENVDYSASVRKNLNEVVSTPTSTDLILTPLLNHFPPSYPSSCLFFLFLPPLVQNHKYSLCVRLKVYFSVASNLVRQPRIE